MEDDEGHSLLLFLGKCTPRTNCCFDGSYRFDSDTKTLKTFEAEILYTVGMVSSTKQKSYLAKESTHFWGGLNIFQNRCKCLKAKYRKEKTSMTSEHEASTGWSDSKQAMVQMCVNHLYQDTQ